MKKVILTASALLLIAGCRKYFGEKTDLSFIDVPQFTNREIAYVPILPAFNGFIKPVDIAVGFDELIYVADEGAQEIVQLDETGRRLGSFPIPGLRAVTQDRRFDLLAIGTADTVIAGSTFTFTCIYRIRMTGPEGYKLNPSNARIIRKIMHPFYYKTTYSNSDLNVQFNRIGVIASTNPAENNSYFVTRTGPAKNPILGPDDAVLLFSNNDQYITPVTVSTSQGTFNDYFQKPFGITTFAKPPQITARTGQSFMVTMLEPNSAIKVQNIERIESEFGAEYRPRFFPYGDTSKSDGGLHEPFKFQEPVGITLSGDAANFIFVVDKAKDSLYQFSGNGLEGVQPPAATGITKLQKASFGGRGNDYTQFRAPMSVAFFKKILYVADSENGRILRFRLTLDFD
ncbi:hypothetical protein JCM31826_02230 [Thermaurantimonas aggregans]|uniref:Lipoprotein n=1 Tax=Thermaurantimonas aggregans TaxID=2173829 RepID=A0A401XIB8_9FLAO|nr:hypothetical protein [Thermaurantimonas aggregans]MCX8149051.1 hypothetical protein [Thermaurantimonas aggregans]GCD76741.1 hypothetical protein JCM31826_02230 [Thermaurantimonas aggregans]